MESGGVCKYIEDWPTEAETVTMQLTVCEDSTAKTGKKKQLLLIPCTVHQCVCPSDEKRPSMHISHLGLH